MAINTNYFNYSADLFGSTSSASSTKASNSLTSLLSGISGTQNSYGANSANTLTSSIQSYLTGAKTQSSNLQNALNSLLGKTKKGTNSFDEKIVTSSNSELMSVKASATAKFPKDDLGVNIKQVATGQINKGAELNAASKNYSSQKYQVELEINGTKTQISFNTDAGDTNKAMQQKMADAINSKNLGVTASISTNEKNGTSILTIGSSKTGDDAKNKFTIKDVSGNAVSRTGVSEVTTAAQNAIYSVNGGDEKTSKTNDIDLGNGITATLKKASTESVKVEMGVDKNAALNKVREMVNGFNGLLSTAEDNNKDVAANRLQTQLKGISKTYSASLARIGINTNSDGYLSIDSDKMQKASENGTLEKFFTDNGKNTSYGFANKLSKVADDVSKNTIDYVSKAAIRSTDTSYVNPTYDYKQNNRMNQMLNTGLLFNYLF